MLNTTPILSTIIVLAFLTTTITAQEIERKSPQKAGIYSAVIPGSGQFYTEKYWKIPIIYIGLFTSGYYIKESDDLYHTYKNAYLNRINNTTDQFQEEYSDAQLRILIDNSKRNREISILCFIGTYILNIIDASVSAHLFHYDISNKLSLNIQPTYISRSNIRGVSLFLNL